LRRSKQKADNCRDSTDNNTLKPPIVPQERRRPKRPRNRSSFRPGGESQPPPRGPRLGRINIRSATRPNDHEPIGRPYNSVPLGTLSPGPWDLALWARDRIKRTRRRGIDTTSPLPLGRRGARVASQQGSILHDGAGEYSTEGDGPPALFRRPRVEDLKGTLKVQALAGPVVELADIGGELLGRDLGQVGALGQVLPQETVGVLIGAAFRRVGANNHSPVLRPA
jgi:hypothetical protein